MKEERFQHSPAIFRLWYAAPLAEGNRINTVAFDAHQDQERLELDFVDVADVAHGEYLSVDFGVCCEK